MEALLWDNSLTNFITVSWHPHSVQTGFAAVTVISANRFDPFNLLTSFGVTLAPGHPFCRFLSHSLLWSSCVFRDKLMEALKCCLLPFHFLWCFIVRSRSCRGADPHHAHSRYTRPTHAKKRAAQMSCNIFIAFSVRSLSQLFVKIQSQKCSFYAKKIVK